jgi:hypothetical protein
MLTAKRLLGDKVYDSAELRRWPHDGTFRPLFERRYPELANDNADDVAQAVAV